MLLKLSHLFSVVRFFIIMKIYHYTSIETLALILHSKKIRFNRLDRVDDVEESCYGSGPTNARLGMYSFVSCWTKDAMENLSLWKMYTGYKGVRIGIDEDMFITYRVNDQFRSFFPGVGDITKEYLVFSNMNEARLYDVEYVPNPEEEIKRISELHDDGRTYIETHIGRIGFYKRKEWEFQKESRFKVMLLPVRYEYLKKYSSMDDFNLFFKMITDSFQATQTNYPLKTEYIDMPLNPEKMKTMEIMLGPQTSEAEMLIVQSLLRDYPDVTIRRSYFYGKINKR